MCLIVFSWQPDAQLPLVLAANRDEFYARPSAAAAFWDDAPGVLAGRDLEAGGTWLGINRSGRFAAVTNIRDPSASSAPRSRGELTADFLRGNETAAAYLARIATRSDQYLGFNLIVGDRRGLWYLHGGSGPQPLSPGVYGLSNAALDVPWPKVELAKARLQQTLASRTQDAPTHAALRAVLADRTLAAEADLHRQGLIGEMAQQLSAQFIVTRSYGTRCTSTLVWHADGRTQFAEERYDETGRPMGEASFELE
jgi:uncharacterized protein with NRDE domain